MWLCALIQLPLAQQSAVIASVGHWLRPGGIFVASVGHRAWTGVEKDWLGGPGADIWWSHADAATYRRWIGGAGPRIELESFIPEGEGGHTFILATAV